MNDSFSRVGPLRLRFSDPHQERLFQVDYSFRFLGNMRWGSLLGMVLYASFAFLDWLTFPEHASTLLTIRLGIVLPLVTLPFWITFTRWHLEFYQRVCLVAPASAGLSIVLMMLVTQDGYTSEYFNGLILVSLYGYAFIRLLFFWAAAANLTFWMAFCAAEILVFDFPLPVVIGHVFFALGANIIGMATAYTLEQGARESFQGRFLLAEENKKSERLLLSILPQKIANKLKMEPASQIAESFENVSILFVDWVGFTDMSSERKPAEVVRLLQRVFSVFDELCVKHQVEKIKTIGDAYMVVSGVTEQVSDHAERVAKFGLEVVDSGGWLSQELGVPITFRVGIASGPVVAGIIGDQRFSYDIWGDTVNTASRMESAGMPGRVQITEVTRDLLGPKYQYVERGEISVKGKGMLSTFFLDGENPN